MLLSIPVYYSPKMVADSLSFSPSSIKPIHVVNGWKKIGISLDIRDVPAIPIEDIYLAHDKEFVDNIFNGTTRNGFMNTSTEIAHSLLYTNGSIRDAAKCAIENGMVAVSPTSGFHHAKSNKANDFCTFNGLMIAVQYLLIQGLARKIGILDCDYHYGDGTAEIINKLNLKDQLVHFSAGLDYREPEDTAAFFKKIPVVIESMKDCDIVLYQAGADPHIDDPLGGFLTTEQLYMRDLLVFHLCKQNKLPVVWNLAGGYQMLDDGKTDWDGIVNIHCNTMKACWKVFGTSLHNP